MKDQSIRCAWASEEDAVMCEYHDTQWGVPTDSDTLLFELLILEGAQAGLSWRTVLGKREAYRQAFDNFDPHKIAKYDKQKIAQLMSNKNIIRNARKINSAITNAQAFLNIQEGYGSFSDYLWSFVGGSPIYNTWQSAEEVPAQTELSQRISKDLKKHGFSFVGPTIMYSYMQAVGMVHDHTTDCFRYRKLRNRDNL
ncbi:MAG: DNA-3-methyladenine glycosylase I [Patescibacteria group bacterium]